MCFFPLFLQLDKSPCIPDPGSSGCDATSSSFFHGNKAVTDSNSCPRKVIISHGPSNHSWIIKIKNVKSVNAMGSCIKLCMSDIYSHTQTNILCRLKTVLCKCWSLKSTTKKGLSFIIIISLVITAHIIACSPDTGYLFGECIITDYKIAIYYFITIIILICWAYFSSRKE